jgi:NAD(P)H-quinone oxidoreductase subunit 4L
MTEVEYAFWLSCAFILFVIGVYGLISQRDAIKILIAIETLVISGNLVFIGVGYLGYKDGVNQMSQTYTLLSLGIGGAIIGIGLAILTQVYQKRGTVMVSELNQLRW